jgi:F0F1-type ATP synthase membrane subunit b/b'
MEKLILPAIHFFGLVAFIVYKTKGSFVDFMKNRHQEVTGGLNKVKTQTAQADAKKKEVEAKFAGLQKEKEMIFSDWKAREADQIKAIKDSTQKNIALMTSEAEMNKKSLEQQIKAQVMKSIADQIIASVEQKVKAGLNDQSHKGINDQFVKEVSA